MIRPRVSQWFALLTALLAGAGAWAGSQAAAAEPSADLSLRVFVSAPSVYAGGKLVYSVVVLNRGPSEATGVTITDVPGAVEVLSATIDGGTCTGEGTLSCTVATLPRNRSARVRLVVVPPAPGEVVHAVSVASAVPDQDPTNNQATVTTPVRPGHSGPPLITVKGRIGVSTVEDAILVRARVGIDEPVRLIAAVVDARTLRPLRLLAGSSLGAARLRSPRGTFPVDVTKGQTLRLRLRLPPSLAKPGRRLALTFSAVDLESEAAELRARFAIPPGDR